MGVLWGLPGVIQDYQGSSGMVIHRRHGPHNLQDCVIHGFLKIIIDYQGLSGITRDDQGLPRIITDYQGLPGIIRDDQGLSRITAGSTI